MTISYGENIINNRFFLIGYGFLTLPNDADFVPIKLRVDKSKSKMYLKYCQEGSKYVEENEFEVSKNLESHGS